MHDDILKAVARCAASPELIATAIQQGITAAHVSTVQHGYAAVLEILNTYAPPAAGDATPASPVVAAPVVEKTTT